MMLCDPAELKVQLRVAVPLAKSIADAPAGTTLTGLPICVPPSENVTVPLGPAVLLLLELILAVNVMGVPEVTVDELGTVEVNVGALVTKRFFVVAEAGGL